MKSLKILFEMFMPEARFPDEKFWNKDGSAIHPDPKGPPAGTVGKTHYDLGVPGGNAPPTKTNTATIPAVYPNIYDVKAEQPEAYDEFVQILADLGMTEKDIPEESFLYDEDGILTVDFQDKDGKTHELFYDHGWEYSGVR